MLGFYYNVCTLQWPGEGQDQVYCEDNDPLLLKFAAYDLLEDFENGKHISTRMDYTSWNESTYPEIVKHQAPPKYYFKNLKRGGVT